VDVFVSLDGFATGPDRGIADAGAEVLAFMQRVLGDHTRS
jgi:hypothetical protein